MCQFRHAHKCICIHTCTKTHTYTHLHTARTYTHMHTRMHTQCRSFSGLLDDLGPLYVATQTTARNPNTHTRMYKHTHTHAHKHTSIHNVAAFFGLLDSPNPLNAALHTQTCTPAHTHTMLQLFWLAGQPWPLVRSYTHPNMHTCTHTHTHNVAAFLACWTALAPCTQLHTPKHTHLHAHTQTNTHTQRCSFFGLMDSPGSLYVGVPSMAAIMSHELKGPPENPITVHSSECRHAKLCLRSC